MKTIKVTDTRMYKPPINIPVVEGKLVLVEVIEPKKNWSSIQLNGKFYRPIIVSETEKIQAGDWCYDLGSKEIYQQSGNIWYKESVKVLALPKHFSPKHLQAIVDGKMKDGDKVLVECTEITPMGKLINEEFTKQQVIFNEIKLNQSNYITLHKVEEKMYTRDEMESLITQAIKDCELDALDYHEAGKYNNLALWLKENIK